MRFRRELLKGCMTTLILSALKDRRQYANELRKTVLQRSAGAFAIPSGSIYPCLHRLEEKGLLCSQEEGMVRVYELTRRGNQELEYSVREWSLFSRAMDVTLGGK
ncbi:MAG TPA: PadR family transcriptional regulator [bacterium]|nr:PadR family transcriptional regulator [bacterium]HQP99979.1 PadR family transcriptional regulator [bacterium]